MSHPGTEDVVPNTSKVQKFQGPIIRSIKARVSTGRVWAGRGKLLLQWRLRRNMAAAMHITTNNFIDEWIMLTRFIYWIAGTSIVSVVEYIIIPTFYPNHWLYR